MQLFMIPKTQNYFYIPFAPSRDDASDIFTKVIVAMAKEMSRDCMQVFLFYIKSFAKFC